MALSMIRPRTIVPSDHQHRRWCLMALLGLSLGFLVLDWPAAAQSPAANYDESKVGVYTLPDPLVGTDGERVTTAEAWNARRRPEILKLFETYMFGKLPTPRPSRQARFHGRLGRPRRPWAARRFAARWRSGSTMNRRGPSFICCFIFPGTPRPVAEFRPFLV